MTAKPCPTCKGFCCVPTNGARGIQYGHDHTGVTGTHDCPDCDDGTYEICGDPEPFIRERSFEDERADVLAWLHDRVAKSYGVGTVPGTFGYNDRAIAEAFERGEHVGWAKRVKP